MTFQGGKIFFFAKVPQKWSSFFKKYIVFFVTLGRGGGQTRYDICHIFFFFEGVPKIMEEFEIDYNNFGILGQRNGLGLGLNNMLH